MYYIRCFFYKQLQFLGLTFRLFSKFTFSRLKVAYKLLSNLQNFNFKKFVLNTGSLLLAYIFRIQKTPFTGIDSNFHSKFTFKICVNLTVCFKIISFDIIYSDRFVRSGIKATVCKIKIFSIFTSSCPKSYSTKLSCAKNSSGEINFGELKIKKVNFFTQSSTKIFCISVFNVRGCLASCLSFRPFLTLGP